MVEQMSAELRVWNDLIFPASSCRARRTRAEQGPRSTGRHLGGLNGLAPTTQNYALGFTVTFPAMDLASIRAKEAGQSANIRAEAARYQQIAVPI